jgi:two-component system chemotaxis response regulator CheV
MEHRIILLLDFEKIVIDISPQVGINVNQVKELGPRERSNKKIVIAEDSAVLRKLLKVTLEEAGYVRLDFFAEGKSLWDYLDNLAASRGEQLLEEIQLVITDIEMPKMDGHHLTRRIKEHRYLKVLPVIIFFSLITDDLRHKGNVVGADEQISKPEINRLINAADRLLLRLGSSAS